MTTVKKRKGMRLPLLSLLLCLVLYSCLFPSFPLMKLVGDPTFGDTPTTTVSLFAQSPLVSSVSSHSVGDDSTVSRLSAPLSPIYNSNGFIKQEPLAVSAPSYVLDTVCNLRQFREKSGLFAIITGIEHSGTTITASLVMNAPNLYGAFETGLLLSDTPSGFQHLSEPFFYKGLTAPTKNHFWGLTNEQREELLLARCPAEQYHLLRRHSPIYHVHNTSWIVDKTPAYYHQLFSIMQRTPGVPVIVTQKEDDAVIRSLQKRGAKKVDIQRRLINFHRELTLCQSNFPERLYVLNHTTLTTSPNTVMTELFAFLGLLWDPSYLTNAALNQKGKLLGRPSIPAFDQARSACVDCKKSIPYAIPKNSTRVEHVLATTPTTTTTSVG